MPLETGTTISALDKQWPLSGDRFGQADDHLRLIKSVLKSQFPGAGGNGLSIPITATEAELNRLSGVTSGIQSQFDAITTSLALKAALASPVFTGTPTVPTPALTDDSLKIINSEWLKDGLGFNGSVNGGIKLPMWMGNGLRDVTINWNRMTGLPTTGAESTTGSWTFLYPFDNLVTGIFLFPKLPGTSLTVFNVPPVSYSSYSLSALNYSKQEQISEMFALAIGY